MNAPRPHPVAVVTGGARRLGRRLCTTLAGRGFEVVILYRDSEADAHSLEEAIVTAGGRAKVDFRRRRGRAAGGGRL